MTIDMHKINDSCQTNELQINNVEIQLIRNYKWQLKIKKRK